MSYLKKTTESLLKYSSKIANKTESYTKVAKVMLEIKKLEGNLEKTLKDLGQYAIERFENQDKTIELNDSKVNEFLNKAKGFKIRINIKKDELQKLKNQPKSSEMENK